MILYQEDIDKYRPMIHTSTKNKSFLRMSIVLGRRGIKNRFFFLALFQPELADVDPHDPNLSDDIKLKIIYECKINHWYFFREICRIKAPGSPDVPFNMHRGNLAAIWTFFNDIDMGLVQPRQTGKTYVIQAIMAYMMFIMADNLDIGMFTKDPSIVYDNVDRLKQVRDSIPSWMLTRNSKEWDRKGGVSYMAKNNYYKTASSPGDAKYAEKLGRGATYGVTHFDEIAFIAYNYIVVPAAVNAMIAASESVRRAGLPSPTIYTTTAGNPDHREGAFALNIFQSSAIFSEDLYDLQNRKELLEYIGRTSEKVMLYLEFSHYQLGKDDAWLKYVASRSDASQDSINRDLLNIWQSDSDMAVIPIELMHKIRQSKIEPHFVDLQDGFMVRWYIPRETKESVEFKNQYLVMGMDTSENIGRDYTTFTILDPRTMDTVAVCRCNDSNTMQVARHISTLLTRYSRMVWIPERNNTGTAIIDFVIEELQNLKINPFTRIYNEVVQHRDDDKYAKYDLYDYTHIPGNIRATFGYRTMGGQAGTSRNMLYKTTMMKGLELNHGRVRDTSIITELGTLTNKNGRIDHPKGCHDDTVISYLLASYFIFFGRNLQVYGIPPGTVLCDISVTGDKFDKDEYNRQLEIRKRISELEDKISRASGSILVNMYTRELNNLKRKLKNDTMGTEPISVAQVKDHNTEISRAINVNPIGSMMNFASKWQQTVNRVYR